MSKQTAVEWLIEQWPILESQLPPWLIDQAKAMEREQHKDTWFDGTSQFDNASEMTYKKDFEDYYNETYKGGDNET